MSFPVHGPAIIRDNSSYSLETPSDRDVFGILWCPSKGTSPNTAQSWVDAGNANLDPVYVRTEDQTIKEFYCSL